MLRKRMVMAVAASAALAATLSPGGGAAGAPVTASSESRPAALTGQELSATMVEWTRQGKTAVEMDRLLEVHGMDIHAPAAYDRRVRQLRARSAAGDVTLNPPFLIHDEGARWYWMANYSWNNTSFSEDMPATCAGYDRCDLLGNDAYGIAFDRDLDTVAYWATFGHRSTSLPSHRIIDPAERTRWGVVYKKQDTVYKPSTPNDLDMYHGNVTVEIHGRPCGVTEAWTKLAHTYGGTGISSISINLGAIGFGFNDADERWTKASQPGRATRSC